MFGNAFIESLTKIAAGLHVPTVQHLQLLTNPGASGLVKPPTTFRVAGGAKNMGVTRPPTPSTNRTATITNQVMARADR
jgi:hypothetical protein